MWHFSRWNCSTAAVQTVRVNRRHHRWAPWAGPGSLAGVCPSASAQPRQWQVGGWLLPSPGWRTPGVCRGQSTLALGWMHLTLSLVQITPDAWVTHKWSRQTIAVSISNSAALPRLHLREWRFISSCLLSLWIFMAALLSLRNIWHCFWTQVSDACLSDVTCQAWLSTLTPLVRGTAAIWETEVCQKGEVTTGRAVWLAVPVGDL